MHPPSNGLTGLLLLAHLLLQGCAHVSLKAGDLMVPDQGPHSARLPAGYLIEDTTIARGGRLVGLTHAHRPGNRTLVLFCGGSSFHRSREGGTVLEALASEADVVLFDYPGLGDSTGVPDPASLTDTADALFEHVVQLPSTREQKRVVYGFSLGGFVAAQLAAAHRVDAVVLEATASDVKSWARSQVPWFTRSLVHIDIDPELAKIDNVAALAGFQGKVLVLAGTSDRQAPAALARDLTRQLQDRRVSVALHEIPGAAHGEIYRTTEFKSLWPRFLAGLDAKQ